MNPTSALSFVLCMICTCNASAPREFAYTAHSVCAKKKEYNGIFCSGLLGERIQGCRDKREEIHLLKTNKQTNKKTITKTKNRKRAGNEIQRYVTLRGTGS